MVVTPGCIFNHLHRVPRRPGPGPRSAERLLPPEGRRPALDRLASLAAQLVGAPSAQVSLLATEQTVVAGAGEAFHHVGARGDLAGRFHELGRAHADADKLPSLDAFVGPMLEAITETTALSTVTRTGEPLLVEDYMASQLPPSLATDSARDQLRALAPDRILMVPIAGNRATLGAMTLVRSAGRGAWTADETATAVEIGRRAGGAWENAQLVRQQRRLSEALQNSLLSTPPRFRRRDRGALPACCTRRCRGRRLV